VSQNSLLEGELCATFYRLSIKLLSILDFLSLIMRDKTVRSDLVIVLIDFGFADMYLDNSR
jgi:hypothetical protein